MRLATYYIAPLAFLCLFFIKPSTTKAQVRTPVYANEFLTLGVGGRGIGMGNAQVAVSQGIFAGYYNPAGLAATKQQYQGALMHTEYFGGIADYDYLGAAARIDTQSVIALSVIRFGIDNIPNTLYLFADGTLDYNRITAFSVADYGFLFSYARSNFKLKGLDVGLNFKVLYRNVGNFGNGWGFGLDAAASYRYKKIRAGLVARDFTGTFTAWSYNTTEFADIFKITGNQIPRTSVEAALPRYILGIGYELDIFKNYKLLPVVDAEFTFDGQRNVLLSGESVSVDARAGLELSYNNMVFLRGGVYNFQRVKNIDKQERIDFLPAYGLGMRIKSFYLDYAITNLGNQSSVLMSHVFSLKVALN